MKNNLKNDSKNELKNESKNALEISRFYVYENVFLLIDILPQNKREKLADAILQYMFKSIEPNFKSKDTIALWINIKMLLDKQKIKIKNGLNGGAPLGNDNAKKTIEETTKKTTKKTTKDTTKDTIKKTTKYIFTFYIFNFIFYRLEDKYKKEDIDKLKEYINKWYEYKVERKEDYKERGLNALLTQIENNVLEYGIDEVCDLINECMASNYKGIIFDKLKKKNQPQYLSFEERKKLEEEKMWENFLKDGENK